MFSDKEKKLIHIVFSSLQWTSDDYENCKIAYDIRKKIEDEIKQAENLTSEAGKK